MISLLAVFILVALLFGAGLAVQWLFVVAAVVLALWLIAFLVRDADARWYR